MKIIQSDGCAGRETGEVGGIGVGGGGEGDEGVGAVWGSGMEGGGMATNGTRWKAKMVEQKRLKIRGGDRHGRW